MKIAVVGSSGYLGRRVMAELRSRELDPVGADIAGPPDLVHEHVDLGAPEESFAMLHRVRPDVVIQLAYLLTSASIANPQRAVRVNVAGINGLFDAAARLGVPRVVIAGSNAVYGDSSDHDGDVDETARLGARTLYGHMKQFNEAMAAHYEATSNTRFVTLRLSSLHGRGKTGLFAPMDLLIRARDDDQVTLPWSRSHGFSFLHVDDAAFALAELAVGDRPRHSAYDSGGEYLTMEALAAVASPLLDLTIDFDEPGLQIQHLSRISGARIREELGFSPRPVSYWLPRELDALVTT
jgi:nucleoside-diphosphate-sugar epimerase